MICVLNNKHKTVEQIFEILIFTIFGIFKNILRLDLVCSSSQQASQFNFAVNFTTDKTVGLSQRYPSPYVAQGGHSTVTIEGE